MMSQSQHEKVLRRQVLVLFVKKVAKGSDPITRAKELEIQLIAHQAVVTSEKGLPTHPHLSGCAANYG
jgi:hypothetical protein